MHAPQEGFIEDVVFTDEWGQHNLRQLMVVGMVFSVLGGVVLVLSALLPASVPPFYRNGLALLGLLTMLIGGASIYMSATRHRFPFMISRRGLYLPDQVRKSSPKTHGDFVPWEEIKELAVKEVVLKGAKIRVYDVTLLTTAGQSRGFGVATHADLDEALHAYRKEIGRSAGGRI